jgi:Cactus-binding C-terminus of cactin protein/Conserved mid region of cactin
MKIICRDRRKKSAADPEGRAVSSVSADIDRLLSPKSFEELEALEVQINRKLDSNEPIDTDYWEQLLKNLLVWKAKAKLKNLYQSVLDTRASALKQQSGPDAAEPPQSPEPLNEDLANTFDTSSKAKDVSLKADEKEGRANKDAIRTDHVLSNASSGRFAVIPNEDFSHATKALYEKEVARGISENEEVFGGEEDVDTKSKALWSGKYRPRKPRYFNRVQMGYEWNKYNQTHYDHDNPPPKVVQGYKFNIFYPDLIDKTKAPTYKIEREGGRKKGQSFAPAGEEDTCLLRFISGPPYEDVAFRIVDKEWDYSAKRERGFKSSFDKGILQLHFQFKKVFYRK